MNRNPGKRFPISDIWRSSFIFWWLVSLATVLMFDLFWMGQTTFRPMSYFAFYPVWFLSAFFLAFPSVFLKRGIFQTLWLLFFDALFIANLMYCRTYFNAIPLQSYALMGNLADFKSSVAESFQWYYISFPVLTLLAFTYFIFSRKIVRRTFPPIPYIGFIAVLGLILWVSDIPNGGIMNRMQAMSEYAYLSSSIPPMYSLAGFLAHDYYKSQEKLSLQDRQEVEEWLLDHANLQSGYYADSLRLMRRQPKNLVVILCESLESWPIEATVEGKELTPNLNRLLKDSTTFYAPKVVTQVGAGRSIEGQLLVSAGLLPMFNKVYAYDAPDNTYFSLPYAMKSKGAKAILLTPDKPYVWDQERVAKAFGYDVEQYQDNFVIDETTGHTKRLSDGSLMRQIAHKLDQDSLWIPGENIMLMTVTNSGHNPFDLPDHLRTISFSGDFPEIIKNYMVTAHYTDASLQTFIDYLKSRPDWEDTMVVITGDHEGLASDRSAALDNPITREFVDPLQHTPLIILNSPVAGRFLKPLGQVDIYSTILDLLRIDDYAWRGMGTSVFDPDHPGVALEANSDIEGETGALSTSAITGIKDSRKISDRIIKFDLLRNYPDSI